MRKKSVTLMEVIVGAVILALTFGSLLAAFVATRRYVARAGSRLTSANLAKGVINDLHDEVKADTWGVGGTKFDPNISHPETDVEIEDIIYQCDYDVSAVEGQDYREVEVTISYTVD